MSPMQGAAIIPHQEIADLRSVLPGEFWTLDELPELVEQFVRFIFSQAQQRRVVPSTKMQH